MIQCIDGLCGSVRAARPLGAACAGAFLLAGVSGLWAADQPQWGERFTRNQVSAETGLPVTFDRASGRNVKWSVELGTSTHSTPVVARGRVLIGSNNGHPRNAKQKGDRGVLMCFDEKDGRFCWQLVVPKRGPTVFWDWPNAGICSPATVEGNRVYVVSNRGEVLCLDLDGLPNGNDGPFQDEARHATPSGHEPLPLDPADADIIWAFDYIKECGVRQCDMGHSSILIDGPYLYVNTSNGVDDGHKHIASPDAPSLIVLDKLTGRLVATDAERIGPRIFHSTWSSPAIAQIQGKRAVVFCGGDGVVYGFEPLAAAGPGAPAAGAPAASLKRLWKYDCDPKGPKEDVHRFISNRKTSPSNIKSMPVLCQDRMYVTGGGDLWWGKEEAWLQCIDPSGQGDLTAGALQWSCPLDKHTMSTPAVHDGLVYVADCGRKLRCVEARTGAVCWTHEARGAFWASPCVADGKIYIGTQNGEHFVLATGREKKLLGSIDLGSAISATDVAANGVLYIATQTRLYALSGKD